MASKEALRDAQRRFYQRHKETVKAYSKAYRLRFPKKCKERGKLWDQAHREQRNAQAKIRRGKFPEKVREVRRRAHIKFRTEMLLAYGNKCACCGETEPKFLSLDHVNNDGATQRREVGKGTRFFCWAKKNGWPRTLQLLCYNCNCAKAYHGQCPHKLV